jgi:hypothetical protein
MPSWRAPFQSKSRSKLHLTVHCSSWLLRAQPLRAFVSMKLMVQHVQPSAVC